MFYDVDYEEDRNDSNDDNDAIQPYHDEPQIMSYALGLHRDRSTSLIYGDLWNPQIPAKLNHVFRREN